MPEPSGAKAVRGPGQTTVNTPRYVRARILWPALGFPEIVATREPDVAVAMSNGTNCINLLLVAEVGDLTAADVSRLLRCVPWDQRRSRYVAPDWKTNSFPPDQIDVQKAQPTQSNDLACEISFAGGYVMAGLAKYVVDLYKNAGLPHIYRIRIYESAGAKLEPGLYNLFWINRKNSDTPQQASAEMALLLDKFAKGRRTSTRPAPPPQMYEFKFGYIRLENRGGQTYDAMGIEGYQDHRTEVLHPLFVGPAPKRLRIAHMADTHCSTHLDIYEMRLKSAGISDDEAKDFNNWNMRFREFYAEAAANSDLVLITGDIIDYGRGHMGMEKPMDKIECYWHDLNWIQFSTMLEAGYAAPVCTVLGNHDWRLHPYAPFAIGAPHFSAYNLCTRDQLEKLHAAGYSGAVTYGALTENPLWTDIESVAWYLLLINPFLDYTLRVPGGYGFLMLDWAQTEEIWGGQQNAPTPITGVGLPVAKVSLTDLQKRLVEWFVTQKDSARTVALHATIMGPLGSWSREELYRGFLKFSPYVKLTSDVPDITVTRSDSKGNVVERYRFVPIRALNEPPEESSRIPPSFEPTHGTIRHKRDWLIAKLQAAKVSLALSGHIHRPLAFKVLRQERPETIFDHSLPKGTAICLRPEELTEDALRQSASVPDMRPLFINANSAGPTGVDRDTDNPQDQGKCILPGYTQVVLAATGAVEKVVFRETSEIQLQWYDDRKQVHKVPPKQMHAAAGK